MKKSKDLKKTFKNDFYILVNSKKEFESMIPEMKRYKITVDHLSNKSFPLVLKINVERLYFTFMEVYDIKHPRPWYDVDYSLWLKNSIPSKAFMKPEDYPEYFL
jgi:hypothetical protein